MKDEAAKILINKIIKAQKWVDTLIEALESRIDVTVIDYKARFNEFQIYKGIENLAKLYDEQLHFQHTEKTDEKDIYVGKVYFTHNGVTYFDVVTQEQKEELLGGDVA